MTPQEKETKLREAAVTSVDYYFFNRKKDDIRTYSEFIIDFAKSEAAREYHHQEPKGFEALKKEWYERSVYIKTKGVNVDGIWKTFAPYLQPIQEIDAVEFEKAIKWARENGYDFSHYGMPNGDEKWNSQDEGTEFTSAEIYLKYKQSKTNNGNQNEQEIKN